MSAESSPGLTAHWIVVTILTLAAAGIGALSSIGGTDLRNSTITILAVFWTAFVIVW